MTELTAIRLRNQFLTTTKSASVAGLVKHLVAVQAQDYAGSLWALGLRSKNATEDKIENAIARKQIIRTWPMRGTLHFVHPDDVRWLLTWLTPRIIKRAASVYRSVGLDTRTLLKSADVISRALEDAGILTRQGIYDALEHKGISTAQQRGLHILGHLAQEQLICFGPRDGKQPTFVRLDDWIPTTKPITGDEALQTLCQRYFEGHGPATLRDLLWWSGMTVTEGRKALDLAQPSLRKITIDKNDFWLGRSTRKADPVEVALLPPFDEYTVAYKDRSPIHDVREARNLRTGILGPVAIVDGQVVGDWKRTVGKDRVDFEIRHHAGLTAEQRSKLTDHARDYCRFLQLACGIVKITRV